MTKSKATYPGFRIFQQMDGMFIWIRAVDVTAVQEKGPEKTTIILNCGLPVTIEEAAESVLKHLTWDETEGSDDGQDQA